MPKTRQVALIVDATRAYHRKIIPGVADYAHQAGNWSLYVEEGPQERLPDFSTWHGKGIITSFEDRRIATTIAKAKIPVVGIEGGYAWYDPASRIPYFATDNSAIGRLGAEHLIDRGFTRLAYCGFPRNRLNVWSQQRADAFAERAGQSGFSCSVYNGRHTWARKWTDLQRELSAWLKSLEKPVGLMACNDARARHVLEACRTIGAQVPEDVAVIGVDNDEILCEVTKPPLSSIEQGARRLGYQAAALLDRLMNRKKVRQVEFLIEPEDVVMRHSTDVLAIEDDDVADAVRFIREHACDGIQVADLLKVVQVSRSTLETKFKAVMGRTVHAEIRRVQIERAKQLIAASDLTLKQVAIRAGFPHVQYMTTVFHRHTGRTPAEYRKRSRV